MSATEDRAAAKARLFAAISSFDEVRSRGGVNVDFGVKGGELDKDTRAPTNLADGGFYAVSEELGKAADDVLARVDELFPLNPTPGSEWDASPKPQQDAFQAAVQQAGVSCTVRDTRGQEIAAACGQLAADG